MITFADRLKELRQVKKVTQKQVAIFLEMTDRAYQNYEYGNSEAPYSVLIKLAEYFNVSTDYLLGCSDDPTRH